MIDVIQMVILKSCKPLKDTAEIVLKTCADRKDLVAYDKADALFRSVLVAEAAEEISKKHPKPVAAQMPESEDSPVESTKNVEDKLE